MKASRRGLILGLCVVVTIALLLAGCTRAKPTALQAPVEPTATPEVAASATPTEVTQSLGTVPASPPAASLTPAATAAPTPLLPVQPTEPAATPTSGEAPTPEAGESTYTVQAGDTLFTLAMRFGTTMDAIASLNGLRVEDIIYVGQKLRIPGTATNAPNVHVVQAGETLYRIALDYGVDWKELAELNNLSDPNALYVGQRLVIPSGATEQPTQQPSGGGVHVVVAGETLWGIAYQYGVTVQALAEANNLDPNAFVFVGQRLVIP